MENNKEHIVCSAIKFKGLVHGGIGCGQIIQNILSFTPKPTSLESREINNNQGFITSTGRFVDRYEAYKIAKANNQIKYNLDQAEWMDKNNNNPYLMSIHLYEYNF